MRDRPYLIIIPSPLIIARTYQQLGRFLNKKFTVLIPDIPATGITRQNLSIWNEKKYADWLIRFMDELHIKKANILGHSNSGAIAMEFALRNPDRVERLILADTIGVSKKRLSGTFLRRVYDGFLEMKFSFLASPHLLVNVALHPLNFFNQVRFSATGKFREKISELRMPVLILWGKKDHTMPQDDAWFIRRNAQKATLYLSSKGSHDWILTESETAAGVIGENLSRH